MDAGICNATPDLHLGVGAVMRSAVRFISAGHRDGPDLRVALGHGRHVDHDARWEGWALTEAKMGFYPIGLAVRRVEIGQSYAVTVIHNYGSAASSVLGRSNLLFQAWLAWKLRLGHKCDAAKEYTGYPQGRTETEPAASYPPTEGPRVREQELHAVKLSFRAPGNTKAVDETIKNTIGSYGTPSAHGNVSCRRRLKHWRPADLNTWQC